MNIFIDESGSFVGAEGVDAWNCVVAYATPESQRRALQETLWRLKYSAGVGRYQELKLRDTTEDDYFNFLRALGRLRGVLFAVATDAGRNDSVDVAEHQAEQANGVIAHVDKAIYQQVRESLYELADTVRGITSQLYVQMFAQFCLIDDVLRRGIIYFVLRQPQTLRAFRWRIDQKNAERNDFERTFLLMLPGILQSSALQEPMAMVEGADYGALKRFEFGEGQEPTFLEDTYGYETLDAPSLDVAKIISENVLFEDSQESLGVQVADLLASGTRRCLRNGFHDNAQAAALLGNLMIAGRKGVPPLTLLGFAKQPHQLHGQVGRLIAIMGNASRALIADRA